MHKSRVEKLSDFFTSYASGALEVGERVPVKDAPVWATPEIVSGGFATGNLLAEGVGAWERQTAAKSVRERNAFYLSREGMAELLEAFEKDRVLVDVPEEAVIATVAYLWSKGDEQRARHLMDTVVVPYMAKFRFYPRILDKPVCSGVRVCNVEAAAQRLQRIKTRGCVLDTREALTVWNELYFELAELLLSTCGQNEWPLQNLPDNFTEQVRSIVSRAEKSKADILEERKKYIRPAAPHPAAEGGPAFHRPQAAQPPVAHMKLFNKKRNRGKLYGMLCTIAEKGPKALSGKEVGLMRAILAGYRTKGATKDERRSRLFASKTPRPELTQRGNALASSLLQHPAHGGLTMEESAALLDDNCPRLLRKKVLSCVNTSLDVLLKEGLVTSGESLAALGARMTAHSLRHAIDDDPLLRNIYLSLYESFRARRSVILYTMEKQVTIEELPFYEAITHYVPRDRLTSAKAAVFRQLAVTALKTFPQTPFSNKMLQEFGFLCDAEFVEETASDIFMGSFSEKFARCAVRCSKFLPPNSLYRTYYGYPEFTTLNATEVSELCSKRALQYEAAIPRGNPRAANGKIIEQMSILTSQNLSTVFEELSLKWTDEELLSCATRAWRCFVSRLEGIERLKWLNRLRTAKNM